MNITEVFEKLNDILINSKKPSLEITDMMDEGLFKDKPFNVFYGLEKIDQDKIYHPEGNVWNHVLLVVDEAAKVRDKSSDKQSFMWAAILHDIGKVSTTVKRNGRWTSYDHDIVGKKMAYDFLDIFIEDKEKVNYISCLIRWHMQILYVNRHLPFADLKGMVKEVDINDITLLCLCDRKGRGNMDNETLEDIERQKDYFVEKALYEQNKLSFQM